jgi:site-specific DNA-adenine methylase
MKAPFPWFGGKRRVADVVWSAFGDVDNYVEPFAGSLAVLLERPASHARKAETVNDADRFLVNFWRALAADPESVAFHADWPVNEADLEARHLWLVNEGLFGDAS